MWAPLSSQSHLKLRKLPKCANLTISFQEDSLVFTTGGFFEVRCKFTRVQAGNRSKNARFDAHALSSQLIFSTFNKWRVNEQINLKQQQQQF